MSYLKLFDPQSVNIFTQADMPGQVQPAEPGIADRRDGRVYVYSDHIVLAVNVAMATGRPLLVRGPSGSGKSTLAQNVAQTLGWRYYEQVISSRMQARDLQWRFDTVSRFNDATAGILEKGKGLAPYIEPGVLWWAFDRESARWRGGREDSGLAPAPEPGGGTDHPRAVVLLDEIDKADPDVPNNLLVPLGSLVFKVEDLDNLPVCASSPPLIFITTNEERQLPPAFLRRCVVLELSAPKRKDLVKIARAHFGDDYEDLIKTLSKQVFSHVKNEAGAQTAPSTAEFLDAVRTCIRLNVLPGSKDWKSIASITLWKPQGPLGGM